MAEALKEKPKKPRKPGRQAGKVETDAGSQEMTVFEKGPAMTPEQIEEIKKENEEFLNLRKEIEERDKVNLEQAYEEFWKAVDESDDGSEEYPGHEAMAKQGEIPEEEFENK